VISLYLFSFFGIILWDEYPTIEECLKQKRYFEEKFSPLEEERQFSPQCLELGKTTKEFMESHGIKAIPEIDDDLL
jgi:hypothetical protein